jgi:hypothetical protein
MATPSATANNAPATKTPKPPDERFWQKYSPRVEFPLSTVASIALHIVVFGLFVIYIAKLIRFDEKTAVPIRPMAVLADASDGGEGAPGSGGGQREAVDETNPMDPRPFVPDIKLEEAKPFIASWAPELANDPETVKVVTQMPNFDKLRKLNDEIGKRPSPGDAGGNAGGNQPGTGKSGDKGPGDGGQGDPNSAFRRSLRWTLVFNAPGGGADYLNQIAAMRGTVVIRLPQAGKAIAFRDPSAPKAGEPFDLTTLQGKVYFIDERPDTVADVARTLGLDFVPREFIAVFPDDVVRDLDAKERSYRNRNPDDIIETKYKVIVRDGKYIVTVIDQRARRR